MTEFRKLNDGWNADPNVPEPLVSVAGSDVLVTFRVNAFQFPEFVEGTVARLLFKNCSRYRLGRTNDEGWYLGQCRFSLLAPAWGMFYAIAGDSNLLLAPTDWVMLTEFVGTSEATHFLFYFRDDTFECVADTWEVQLPDPCVS